MKKASQSLLLVSGIFGILAIVAFAIIGVYGHLLPLSSLGLFIGGLVQLIVGLSANSENAVYCLLYWAGAFYCLIAAAYYILLWIVSFVILLVQMIMAFIGRGKSKVINIMNIVFGALTFIPVLGFFLTAQSFFIYFVVYFLYMFIWVLTPFFWMGIGTIAIVIFCTLTAVFSIIGGILGVVANRKPKAEMELEPAQ